MSGVSVVLALASAVSYGIGDFLGGEGGRRSSPAQMSMLVQVVGLVAATVIVAGAARPIPAAAVLMWGALSGVGSAVGNLALYRGLAQGSMNVVAPLSAVLTAVLPAVVGLAGGDRLPVAGWMGLLLALPAIGLVSLSTDGVNQDTATSPANPAERAVRAGVGWGLLAGAGFGLLFIALAKAGTQDGPWPLLPGQIVAVIVVMVLTVPGYRRAVRIDSGAGRWRRGLPWGVAAGLGGPLAICSTSPPPAPANSPSLPCSPRSTPPSRSFSPLCCCTNEPPVSSSSDSVRPRPRSSSSPAHRSHAEDNLSGCHRLVRHPLPRRGHPRPMIEPAMRGVGEGARGGGRPMIGACGRKASPVQLSYRTR